MSGPTPEQRNLEGRFVEWFLGEYDIDPAGDDWRHLTEALSLLAAAPSDDDLGAAWHEAEAALPEGARLQLTRGFVTLAYLASAHDGSEGAMAIRTGVAVAEGPTPSAALRALTAQLRTAT